MKKLGITIGLCLSLLVGSFSSCAKQSEGSIGDNNAQQNSQQSGQTGAEEGEGKYSKLLQGILDSDYYTTLIAEKDYDVPEFQSHPYAFFKAEGYNVSAIRNGEIYAKTVSFVKDAEPNNLYIATYVENAEGNYYTQYILRYVLTDKEMEDYDMIHDVNHSYIQATLMNNEIAKQKDVKVLSKVKYDIDRYEDTYRSFVSNDKHYHIILSSFTELEPVHVTCFVVWYYLLPQVSFMRQKREIAYGGRRCFRTSLRNDIWYGIYNTMFNRPLVEGSMIPVTYYDSTQNSKAWNCFIGK